eukprot:Nitzschia sp. Nitz4//scaffold10_size219509//145753//146847//NITZ4_001445-RA/size219509-processed-gene-0.139-mRNA-1//-1//CDS//3329532971//9303//frame0
MTSLGTGGVSPTGMVTFCPSPQEKYSSVEPEKDLITGIASVENESASKSGRKFIRKSSSFLRVADLGMDSQTTSVATEESDESHPNFHHPASDPPPGVDHDPKEQWVALNDCDGVHAPIAPLAVDRLADFGLTTTMNASMWIPDTKTDRTLKRPNCPEWMNRTFKPGCVCMTNQKNLDKDVLIWSGNFVHGFYGSDLPAIRAAGMVGMSAKALTELLVDSSRVKEYNKMSLGRKDLQVFQDDMHSDGPFGRSITKVMRSESKPPMVRKTLVFVTVLHAKELIDGSGYLLVTRAVHHPDEQGAAGGLSSEILMGVNVIRKVQGVEDKCLMINIHHIRPPIVSSMLAKRVAISAAVGFINDIRAIC